MIKDMSLKMLHHILRRTGVVPSLESGSGYMVMSSWVIYSFILHLHTLSNSLAHAHTYEYVYTE